MERSDFIERGEVKVDFLKNYRLVSRWATKNNKDATNSWIWSPSHHPDRTLDVDKDEYPNITSGASTSNDLRALGDMDEADHFFSPSDNNFWANNYSSDS